MDTFQPSRTGASARLTSWHTARAVLQGLAACTFVIVAAVGVFWLGFWIGVVDERHHVPGHLIHRSMMAVPGLLQLLYIVPLFKLARRRGLGSVARGLAMGSALVCLANAAAWALWYRMSEFD